MSDIKRRTDWQLINNPKITVLVLEVVNDDVEFTEEQRVLVLPKFLFLQCFEACNEECK